MIHPFPGFYAQNVAAMGRWTPALLSPALWFQNQVDACYKDAAKAQPCAATDSVYTMVQQGGISNDAVQATSGNRPTIQSDGLQLNTTSAYLQLNSTLSLTGDFTLYMVGNIASTAVNWIPFGSTADSSCIMRFSDSKLYLSNSAGSFPTAPTMSVSGLTLLRVRRTGTTIGWNWTGKGSETTGTLSGTMGLNAIGSRPNLSQWNGSTSNRHNLQLGFSSNLTPGGADDLNVLAWIQAVYGVGL